MEITKIYYEELRSEQINGKWTSKKIGAEVSVKENDVLSENLEYVKNYVKRNLDNEDYAEKTAKQMLDDIRKQAKKIMNGL
mgnify:CR=1 FL=1